MKRFTISLCLAVALLLSGSCHRVGGPVRTKVYSFEDSTAHAQMTFSAELPTGTDKVSRTIRESLLDLIDRQLGYIVSYEGQRQFDAFDGDKGDTEAYVRYYFDKALDILARDSDSDARDREQYMAEDADIDEAEKAEILARMPRWEYEFGLSKDDDNPRYAVFRSQDYVYMGGAHGGVTGAGCLTFDKKTGRLVESFLDADCAGNIQPLLRAGLMEYFSGADIEVTDDNLDDFLLLDGDLIPLPAWQPFPAADGLVFTYQQYEIAPYAAGMPSFTIPAAKLEQYLSEDARKVLGL